MHWDLEILTCGRLKHKTDYPILIVSKGLNARKMDFAAFEQSDQCLCYSLSEKYSSQSAPWNFF